MVVVSGGGMTNDALTREIITRLHTGQPRIVLDQIAALCGATQRAYTASPDAGAPWTHDTTPAPSGQHSGAQARER